MKLQILVPGQKPIQKEYDEPITPEEILSSLKPKYPIFACRFNNRPLCLNEPLGEDGALTFLDIRDSYANMVYQTSLILLYIKSVHDVLGKDVEVTIANSLSKGLFTVIHISYISDETIQRIEEHMHKLAEEDVLIKEKPCSHHEIEQWVEKHGLPKEKALYASAPDLKDAAVCTLGDEEDIFYLHAVPSTGYLKLFNLKRYRSGILLRFPSPENPDIVPPYEEQRLLYDAFSEETQWERLLEVSYAADLNERILSGNYNELIQISEALHEKKIAEIAEEIYRTKKRIILIAGPSSSGKTSFAKRLCIQLKVTGLKPLYLGTDDYFINRDEVPLDEKGNKDFESLRAVDVNLFTSQMNDLLAGKETDIPAFDFIEGKKIFGRRITKIDPSQPIVIEGIHGLNPQLTTGIAEDEKFRIYISPLTQLKIDEHHRIPTTDARMIRRLVRDYRTRGTSAAGTIAAWPLVRHGEEHNIFPYNQEADVFFNSQAIYELSVLKKYAVPLLAGISKEQKEYPEAQRMLQLMDYFVAIPDDTYVPNNSIIREFIGSSVLVN